MASSRTVTASRPHKARPNSRVGNPNAIAKQTIDRDVEAAIARRRSPAGRDTARGPATHRGAVAPTAPPAPRRAPPPSAIDRAWPADRCSGCVALPRSVRASSRIAVSAVEHGRHRFAELGRQSRDGRRHGRDVSIARSSCRESDGRRCSSCATGAPSRRRSHRHERQADGAPPVARRRRGRPPRRTRCAGGAAPVPHDGARPSRRCRETRRAAARPSAHRRTRSNAGPTMRTRCPPFTRVRCSSTCRQYSPTSRPGSTGDVRSASVTTTAPTSLRPQECVRAGHPIRRSARRRRRRRGPSPTALSAVAPANRDRAQAPAGESPPLVEHPGPVVGAEPGRQLAQLCRACRAPGAPRPEPDQARSSSDVARSASSGGNADGCRFTPMPTTTASTVDPMPRPRTGRRRAFATAGRSRGRSAT